jgi:hypothetical protein
MRLVARSGTSEVKIDVGEEDDGGEGRGKENELTSTV